MTKGLLQKVALVVLSVTITLFMSEVAYRTLVVLSQAKKVADPNLTASIFGESYVVNDLQFGYSYNPGKEICVVGIAGEKASSCSCPYTSNVFGTFESDITDFEKAQSNTGHRGPRILVFGDSFTSIPHDGETWVSLFSKRLKEKLDPNAQVLNFGRDGYGVLQMMELAAGQIDIWKPDVVLFAFITADLPRRKFWRKTFASGQTGGWYVTFDPKDDLNAFDSQFGQLTDKRVTKQWCEEVMKSDGNDPLIAPMADFYKRMREFELNKNAVTFFTPQSFIFNRIFYGQPVIRRSRFQGQKFSFLNDTGLKTAIAKLDRSGIPYYFVHLPMLPEIKKKVRWLPSADELRLSYELLSMAGQKRFLFLGDYLDLTEEQLALFPVSSEDGHPSKDGIRYFADAMINLYLDKDKPETKKDIWTEGGRAITLTKLVNRAPLFDSRDDWGPGLAKAVGYGPGVIVGPGADNPEALSQQFPAQPNAVFKIVARASTPHPVDVFRIVNQKTPKKAIKRFLRSFANKTNGRFQIDWSDSNGKFISSFIEPFETYPKEITFETYAIAPENTSRGTLYALSEGSNMVRYTEVSLYGKTNEPKA